MSMDRPNNWNIPMILHDWAAGKTSTDIAKIYGFSSANACLDRISKWRKAGWPFPKKTEEDVEICKRCHGKGYIVVERNGEEGEIRCEGCKGYGCEQEEGE
jgi:hypothetical protein